MRDLCQVREVKMKHMRGQRRSRERTEGVTEAFTQGDEDEEHLAASDVKLSEKK